MIRWRWVPCKLFTKRGCGFLKISGLWDLITSQNSAFFWPALTTVNHDQFNLGKVAVEETIKIIELNRQGLVPISPKTITLEPTLVVRGSSLRLKV